MLRCCFCDVRQMARDMNTHSLWSNSNTKDILVTYAEGLACDNFDKKQYYNVHRNSAFTWFVLNKAAGTMPMNTDNASKIKFDRVRTVLIDANQFMTCSCGYIQRCLLLLWSTRMCAFDKCTKRPADRCTII